MAETEGGGKEDPKKDVKPTITAPANYAPLQPGQRQEWNDFLTYVDKQGYGGSTKLDARDQSLGINLMNQYKKQNPSFSITPQDIQKIQYDQYLLRKGDSYPGLTSNQLSYMRNGLNPAYMAREVSPVDNWLGSKTSKLYYPTAVTKTANGDINYGTNFEKYLERVK